ncbi:hypothetical protein METP3_00237 [Methanosarcinales archaeon]|nr:hypothetical protein METP3_00237 [Methanosarcinales archaeon]
METPIINTRKKIYAVLSTIISDDQPLDFLAYPAANVAFSAKVKGIEPGKSMSYNYQEWYFG